MTHGIAQTCNFLPPPNIFPYIALGAQDPGLHSSIGLSEALGVAADLCWSRAGVQAPGPSVLGQIERELAY